MLVSEYTYTTAELGYASTYLLPMVREYVKDLSPGSVVLDLGCGNGAFLAQFLGKGLRLHGIDQSVSGVTVARQSYPDLAVTVADITDDLSTHPLAGTCDLVLCTEVVEHVVLPRRLMRNAFHLLTPGGMFLLSTPYHGYLKNLALAVSGHFDAHWDPLWDYGHIKFWSRRTLTALLQEVGFTVTGFQGAGRVRYFWKSMVLTAVKPR